MIIKNIYSVNLKRLKDVLENAEYFLKRIEEEIEYRCDICKKFYSIDNNTYETQEFLHFSHLGGYGSTFGDGNKIEIDICQHCLKEKLGQYLRITIND